MRIAPPLSWVNALVFIALAILTFVMIRDRLAARGIVQAAGHELGLHTKPSLRSIVMLFQPRHMQEITEGQQMSPLRVLNRIQSLSKEHQERLQAFPTITKLASHENP